AVEVVERGRNHALGAELRVERTRGEEANDLEFSLALLGRGFPADDDVAVGLQGEGIGGEPAYGCAGGSIRPEGRVQGAVRMEPDHLDLLVPPVTLGGEELAV